MRQGYLIYTELNKNKLDSAKFMQLYGPVTEDEELYSSLYVCIYTCYWQDKILETKLKF